MPRLIEDIFAEINAIRAYQRASANASASADLFTEQEAQRMAVAARMWPGLPPGALLALTKGGYRPDHPMVRELATATERLRLRDHPAGTAYGEVVGRNAAMRRELTAGQRRLIDEDARRATADPGNLKSMGVIDADGMIHRPARPRFDEDTGSYQFDDAGRQVASQAFLELMAAVAAEEGTDTPIPFIDDTRDGQLGLYYPKTGNTGTLESDRSFVIDLPGGLDDRLRDVQAKVTDYLLSRRLPQAVPGLPEGGTTLQAGMGSPREVAQSTFAALDMPVQEAQGLVRKVYGVTHGEPVNWWEPQSDFLIATANRDLGMGGGLFVDPESRVAAERRRREEQYGQIGGHNVTLGRWVADGLTPWDPDHKGAMILSGLVDFGVQVADPSAFVLGQGAKARAASRLFAPPGAASDEVARAAGVVKGLRWQVNAVDAAHWLDSPTGVDTLTRLTELTSPSEIRRAMNYKVPSRVAVALADAHTPSDVRKVLEPELGTSIREVATATVTPGLGGRVPGRTVADPRRLMPSRGKIDAHDTDLVSFELESWLRNAKASDEDITRIVDRAMRADSPGKLNAAVRDALREANGILHRAGITDPAVREKLTRLHADAHEATSNTFVVNLAGQATTDNPLLINGEQVWYPGAHLLVEHAPRYLQLPDAREIRAAISEMPHLFTKPTGELRKGTLVLDWLQNRLWKPAQLIRFAWTARVVGEEQVRMAAAGLTSMFRHPVSFIAWRTGRKGTGDVLGGLLDEAEEFHNAMARAHGGWIDRPVIRTGHKTQWNKTDLGRRNEFIEGWAGELATLHADPVARQLVNADSFDDAVEWFTRGKGNRFRADLAAMHPDRFQTVDDAANYLRTVQTRIDHITSGDGDLLAALRKGKLDGENLIAGTGLNMKAVDKLAGRVDDLAPDVVTGDDYRTVTAQNLGLWDRAVDSMFGVLMTNRTNNLSRSPTFKQNYWQEAERLIGFGDETAKDLIIAEAKANGLGSRAIRRMERVKARGELNAAEIDTLAKGHALEATKDLLYDMTRRGRFMDAARLVFPFGEAWHEVLGTWGRMTRENPKVIRRFQQLVQGARGEDFGEIMGAPEGQGFFWKNEFGDEVFVWPGTGFLTDKLLGVPIPMVSRAQGLSMFGTVMPGLGPVVQIPTGWFLQNKPGPQAVKELLGELEGFELPVVGGTIRDQLVPFGSIGDTDQAESLSLSNYLPVWMRTGLNTLFAGDIDEYQWNNTVMSVAGYLRTSGRYGTSRADMQQLMADAAEKAKYFMVIKMLGQGALPASPSPDWLVVSNDGRELRVRALAEEYRKLQREDYASADSEFVDRYGVDVLAAVQPKTAGVEYGVPTSREGAQWVLEHPGVRNGLPHTYGFFAPKGGEFDYSLFAEQLADGERHQLTPDEYGRLMNRVQAEMILEDAKNQLGDDVGTDAGRLFLRDVRAWLDENYSGWNDLAGIPSRPSQATMIRELYDALDNPDVMATDAGKGLALYLEGRDQVVAHAQSLGLSGRDGVLTTSRQMDGGRLYLQDLAAWVIEKHPGFEDLYEVVLSRETEVEAE